MKLSIDYQEIDLARQNIGPFQNIRYMNALHRVDSYWKEVVGE